MTTTPVFFLDALPAGSQLVLSGEDGRHAARVRRLRVGEAVRVGDGAGAVADCVIAEVLADGLSLDVLAWATVPVPSPRLVVVQALAKGDRGELAVETMTELGVDEIVPWAASRSVVRWDGPRAVKNVQRWQRIAREAAKQSRRAWLPVIGPLAALSDVAARLSGGFVLHESADLPLSSAPLPADGDLVLVVGPEGGVSDAELDAFRAAGASAVRLGGEVLRTSTAGAAALAALSVRLGRWS